MIFRGFIGLVGFMVFKAYGLVFLRGLSLGLRFRAYTFFRFKDLG